MKDDSQAGQKFSQVFKNNIHDIDLSGVETGNVYSTIRNMVESMFTVFRNGRNMVASSVMVVDAPSLEASLDGTEHQFKYSVKFDLELMQNKNAMKENNDSDFWCIGSAVVKDIVCDVVIVPDSLMANPSGGNKTIELPVYVE